MGERESEREKEWEREREKGGKESEREREKHINIPFFNSNIPPLKKGGKKQKSPLPLLHFLKIHQADLLLKQ